METLTCTADGPAFVHHYSVCECGWRSSCAMSDDYRRNLERDHLLNGCPPFAALSGLVIEPSMIGPVVGRYGKDNAEYVELGIRVMQALRWYSPLDGRHDDEIKEGGAHE